MHNEESLDEATTLIEKAKVLVDSWWAKYLVFRVAFVIAFPLLILVASIYAFSVFQPSVSWLAIVLLAVYYGWKYRTSPTELRGKFWWVPLGLSALSTACFAYYHYTLNRIGAFVFSAALFLISGGYLAYYSTRMRGEGANEYRRADAR